MWMTLGPYVSGSRDFLHVDLLELKLLAAIAPISLTELDP